MTDKNKTKVLTKIKVKTPEMFNVLLMNDHYTTMEFVISVLVDVFHKSATEAEKLMLTIHFQGTAVCGTYPFAVAETKADQVRKRARMAGFPLRAVVEKE